MSKHKRYVFLITIIISAVCLSPTALHANKTMTTQTEANPYERQVMEASKIEKIIGLTIGGCIIWLIIGYKRMERKNEMKEELLRSKEAEHEEALSCKEETIDKLQAKVMGYEQHKDMALPHEGIANITSATIYHRFKTLAERPLAEPSEDEWRNMLTTVEQNVPRFRDKLMGEYTLSSKEYRICILVLLAFKPGEMVNLTGFSSSDISKTRQRLLMKLFGEQGSAGQFDRRLRGIIK